MTAHQWIDQGSSGRDVLAVCSECRPQWREWAVSKEHAHSLLLAHARDVHGTNSAAWKRMHARERQRQVANRNP